MHIGFVGAGQMAKALAGGFVHAGLCQSEDLFATDVVPQTLEDWQSVCGGRACTNIREVCQNSDVVFISVKPGSMEHVAVEIGPNIEPRHLVVSIVAGATIARIEHFLGEGSRLVRVMPNTPSLVGCGAAGIAGGTNATSEDLALATRLFESIGVAFVVEEHLLNAVTGLSGSGPAFVFQFIEAMSDGGVYAGLPRNIATQLAMRTVLGAARLAVESGKHPGELKDEVASPGGTTIEGIATLERAGFRSALIDAVMAAAQRAEELGQE